MSCPTLYSESLYMNGQDFKDILHSKSKVNLYNLVAKVKKKVLTSKSLGTINGKGLMSQGWPDER